jgi:hypothetical protein
MVSSTLQKHPIRYTSVLEGLRRAIMETNSMLCFRYTPAAARLENARDSPIFRRKPLCLDSIDTRFARIRSPRAKYLMQKGIG